MGVKQWDGAQDKARGLTRDVTEPLKVRAEEEVVEGDADGGQGATTDASDMAPRGRARLEGDGDGLRVGSDLRSGEGQETEGGGDGEHRGRWLLGSGRGEGRAKKRPLAWGRTGSRYAYL